MIEQLQQTSSNAYAVTTPKTESSSTSTQIGEIMRNVTVEKAFKAGDNIPLSFQIEGDVFNMEPTMVSTLHVTHDFFVRISEDNLLFSIDGEKWSDFTEAFTGNLGFWTNLEGGDPLVNGHLLANIRESA